MTPTYRGVDTFHSYLIHLGPGREVPDVRSACGHASFMQGLPVTCEVGVIDVLVRSICSKIWSIIHVLG